MTKDRKTVPIFRRWYDWWHRKSAQQKQIDAFAARVRGLVNRLSQSSADLKRSVEGNQP